jgi:hypothetical protein
MTKTALAEAQNTIYGLDAQLAAQHERLIAAEARISEEAEVWRILCLAADVDGADNGIEIRRSASELQGARSSAERAASAIAELENRLRAAEAELARLEMAEQRRELERLNSQDDAIVNAYIGSMLSLADAHDLVVAHVRTKKQMAEAIRIFAEAHGEELTPAHPVDIPAFSDTWFAGGNAGGLARDNLAGWRRRRGMIA